MAGRKQSRGKCAYCGYETTKGSMSRHLSSCAQRQQVIAQSEQGRGAPERLYHLRAQDAYRGDYWLDLEVRGSATLKDLDHYLRAIWLKCCGHLSRFSFGGWGGGEIGKTRLVSQVFERGMPLTHIYDFGTSSETLIKLVAVRQGRPTTRHPIALMARNLPPEAACIECGQPASWLCLECMYDLDSPGTLCDAHAQDHPHHNYGEPIRLVNSPRVGICGYEGPAEPPY